MTDESIRILLIEDDEDDQFIFRNYLGRLNDTRYELIWASTFSDGIKQLHDNDIKVAFIDYQLNGRTGLELLDSVSQEELNTALILLTGVGSDELGIEALRLGAVDYLDKANLTPRVIDRAIRYAIERAESKIRYQNLLLEKAAKESALREQALLQESQERLILAQKAAKIGSFEWIIPENINRWTEELERLYEMPAGSFGSTFEAWRETLVPEDVPRVDKTLESALSNACPDFETEWRIVTPTGRIRDIYCKAEIYYDGEMHPRRMVGINMDITERKVLEQQKDALLGVVSHELRTPVTSIKAYTQILHRKLTRRGDIESAQSLARMDAQLNKLNRLINDLLDVTKIKAGKLQFRITTFDFDALVDQIVEDMRLTSEQHKIVVTGHTHAQLEADEERTGQVIINLISNAIKYSPLSDRIEIIRSSDKDSVSLSVRDHGVGIPLEMQPHVFEQFFRVTNDATASFPGLGLGLYISSQIIERSSGRIWVEQPDGPGTKFSFTLPRKSAESVEHTTRLQDSSAQKN